MTDNTDKSNGSWYSKPPRQNVTIKLMRMEWNDNHINYQ